MTIKKEDLDEWYEGQWNSTTPPGIEWVAESQPPMAEESPEEAEGRPEEHDPDWYDVVDNFLPTSVFDKLRYLILPTDEEIANQNVEECKQIPWYYAPYVVTLATKEEKPDRSLFYLAHMIYDHTILSPLFNELIPACNDLLDFKSLIRAKINMYPNTEILKEHGMHTDYAFPHKAGILSINTCDGYTKLEDGTKIDSVANRMLLFDASRPHTPSTTTDQTVRVNINFNYF